MKYKDIYIDCAVNYAVLPWKRVQSRLNYWWYNRPQAGEHPSHKAKQENTKKKWAHT